MNIRRFKWNPEQQPSGWGMGWQYVEFQDEACFASRSDATLIIDSFKTPWTLVDAERLVSKGNWVEIEPHLRHALGDWPEDFEHENGCYRNTCTRCASGFTGPKCRVLCKVCDRALTRQVSVAPLGPIVAPARLELRITTEAGDEVRTIPSIHSQTLFDHFRNFRYAQVGVNGLGSVYTDAVTFIDGEVQRLVAEFLEGLP